MGIIQINQPSDDLGEATDPSAGKSAPLRLHLTGPEIQLLLKACKRYRAAIPSYLQSRQAEVKLIDQMIQKLSK